MKDYSDKNYIEKSGDKGLLFHILKWTLIILLAFSILSLITKPLRKKWSEDYLARGDIYLEQKKYLSAELEYQKSFSLYHNEKSSERIDLAKKAQTDVLTLESFLKERKVDSQINLFDDATKVPETATEAVRLSKQLIEEGEYQLATISAKTAIEMDQTYVDGWLYLGIADTMVTQNVEIDASSLSFYKKSGKNSLQKALSLSPGLTAANDYLNILK